MNSPFFNRSKLVADEFIQSIVFLDDRVHQKDGDQQDAIHDLDSFELSKVFAEKKKICAVYDPKTRVDVDNFKFIANKADIIVLDWFIAIDEDSDIGGNEEADAEDQLIKGTFTKEIIEDIISTSKETLKIILIYTGETDLLGITREISENIEGSILLENDCQVDVNNIRILIRAKSNNQEGEDARFNHIPELRGKIVKYADLPEFLLCEFTKLTEGLLSNFVLKSLSVLRTNTSTILGLYNRKLDYAYLEHRSSIPNGEDAENLIIDVFKDSIGDLLHYKKVKSQISKDDISKWVNDRVNNIDMPFKKKDGSNVVPDAVFKRDKKLLLTLLSSTEKDVQKKFTDLFIPLAPSKAKAEEYVKYLALNNIDLFINPQDEANKSALIREFAKLTHHKNVFLPRGSKPFLTLGTVLKSKKTSKYFICIQQKCDSVRITADAPRKFLFLPLEMVESGKFNFLTPDDVKLKLGNKSYELRTLKFHANKDGIVQSTSANGKFIFQQLYKARGDEKFEWVLDLKDLHSQRIVTEYASILSRVGLDESEWLRKSFS